MDTHKHNQQLLNIVNNLMMKSYLILVVIIGIILFFLSGGLKPIGTKGSKFDTLMTIIIGSLVIAFFIYACNEIGYNKNSPFNGPSRF